jgi:hypothetical protein
MLASVPGLLSKALGLLATALSLLAAPATSTAALDVQAVAAFGGWSRSDRVTELAVRLTADAPTRVTLALQSGPQTLRSVVDLQAGRAQRLHLPLRSGPRIDLVATPADGAPQRMSIDLSLSETPLLAVALADGQGAEFQGFHAVALAADQLPRQPAAFASVDALVIDAPTLSALDPRQLQALLDLAATCGRIVVVAADAEVRRVLDAGAGCGGRTLVHAASPAQAGTALEAALSAPVPPVLSDSSVIAWSRPGLDTWRRAVVVLAGGFAAAALAIVVTAAPWPMLGASALGALLALLAVPGGTPESRLVVWSEGASGASFARYQGWQWVTGSARGTLRVELPPQLAASVRPCQASQAVQFDFDVGQGRIHAASFESRLFGTLPLCYEGQFPQARSLVLESAADGAPQVRNAGALSWPAGRLLWDREVATLPALAPGETAPLAAPPDPAQQAALQDAVARTAQSRRPDGATAGLWALELDTVAGTPPGAQAWLLLSAVPR